VLDADRAKHFYAKLGWTLELDFTAEDDFRVIQFTPSGSSGSVIFGTNVTTATPGSAQGLHLIVADLEAARSDLAVRGVDVSESFHDAGGVFHHASGDKLVIGLNPQRASYASYASFSDPDGNGWVLQEVTSRLSAGVHTGDARFTRELVAAAGGGDPESLVPNNPGTPTSDPPTADAMVQWAAADARGH
jgi:catechol 2,3-dioxygenase-like lactoylglutathione lyase family enzyme